MASRCRLPLAAAAWAVAALLLAAALPGASAAQGRSLQAVQSGQHKPPHRPQDKNVKKVTWRVSLAVAAPDCYSRPVILVNGEVGPALEVEQGQTLQLTLCNDLPDDWPAVDKGISIHWHGWRMSGGAQWYDGPSYVTQCPVVRGTCFTSRFVVNERPGSYMWHGHTGNDRSEGLAGPLIVRPRQGAPQPAPVTYDEERVLFLGDWWHAVGGANAMPLNRPFDANRTTPDSGAWAWVNNAQAILINGHGNWMDCKLNAGGVTTPPVVCNVTNYTVPAGANSVQPGASAANPGCTHANVTVEAGKTYLVRIISAASLSYQTLCFEGHDVAIVAVDAVPVEPIRASALNASRPGCVDVNSGNRFDVLLKANRPVANYWVSSTVQYRPGSPSGYAVLHYKGAPETLPTTPPPQPQGVAPWTTQEAARLVMDSRLLAAGAAGQIVEGYEQAEEKVPAANLVLQIDITQPLMSQTGQLRWALNNVVSTREPPCDPLLDLLKRDPKWIQSHLVPAAAYNRPDFNSTALGKQEGGSGRVQVFLTTADGSHPPPVYPTAGTHLIPLKLGQVVELVLQNLPANAHHGDYRAGAAGAGRNATEQHPFHLHGHHFWLLGSGVGTYNAAANASSLNTVNPPLRDTATLPQGGWVVVRFRADNPGVWLFHCHLLWHELMGQAAMFVTDVAAVPRRPKGMPKCSKVCTYNAAPWAISTVNKEFGDSGFELPRGNG